MYSFTERVRYSETDETGHLSMTALLNYFQDCATFHSSDVGLSGKELKRRGMMWVLSAWQIQAARLPEVNEYVKIRTIPYSFRGFLGYRNFMLETMNGERIAIANSIWTLVDTENGKPVRMPEDLPLKYGVGEPLNMGRMIRHIKVEGEPDREHEPILVMHHLLDSNGHVNNSQYVRLAQNCLPDEFRPMQLRAEYKHSAFERDILYPKHWKTENGYIVQLCDESGSVYAAIEFQ